MNFEAAEPPGLSASIPPSSRYLPWRLVKRLRLRSILIGMVLIGVSAAAIWWGVSYRIAVYRYGEGMQALQNRQLRRAETLFQDARRWNSLRGGCTLSLARVARLNADQTSCRELIHQALWEGASVARTAREKLLLKIQSNAPARFKNQRRRLLSSQPDDATAVWQAYAFGWMTTENNAAAITFLKQWEAAQPNSAIAKWMFATFYIESGEWELAERYYREAINLNPNMPDAWIGLARIMAATDQKSESLKCYRQAVHLDPQNILARLRTGKLLLETGNAQESRVHFEFVLSQQPHNFSARFEMASLYLDEGEPAKAIELVTPIIHLFPDDVALNYVLANAHSELGNQADAKSYLERHIVAREKLDQLNSLEKRMSNGVPTPQACKELGLGYLKYQWELADLWLQQALAMNPRDVSIVEALLLLARKNGDPIAIRRYTDAIDLVKRLTP